MSDLEQTSGEPPMVGILATLLAGIAIGAAAVMLANQQNELGGVKLPQFKASEWRSRLADAVISGRDRILRPVDR